MTDHHRPTDAPPAPRPTDILPGLDDEQLEVLGRIGSWWSGDGAASRQTRDMLPVDPTMGTFPARPQVAPAGPGRIVEISHLTAPPRSGRGEASAAGHRWISRLRRVVLGAPLRSTAIAHESMRKIIALPVLSADALSSVAYGPEAMLGVLVLAGAAGTGYALPIAAVVVILMLTVGVSYRQTIRAYPHGGGSYIVASANLGRTTGLLAAGGLLLDYVLTVAVSISSGIAAITSAIPVLRSATVPLGVAVIGILLLGNLRGIRQAGLMFAAPTYAFVVAVIGVVVVGMIHPFGPAPTTNTTTTQSAATGVGVLLIMRAFASGSTAMTGIEAIANAVPVFRPDRWRNARLTLTVMIGILVTLFAGIVVLAARTGVVPVPAQTVLSQLARHSFGGGPVYGLVQAATAAILLLAANTAYNDFPRVLFLLARDDQAPRAMMRFGDRLAFSNGIVVLSVAAATVYIVFAGRTAALIPLYAVGVFLAFTLSQTGMMVHWWRKRGPHWRGSLAFNTLGAVLSGLVLLTAAIAKFTSGAWVALAAIGALVWWATTIRRHYTTVETAVRLHPDAVELPVPSGSAVATDTTTTALADESEEAPQEVRHLTVVAIAAMDLAALRALAYAASMGQPTVALHISPDDDEAARFRGYWSQWGDHLPLEVLVSPYRAVVGPLVRYLESLHRKAPGLTITVVLPEIVTRRRHHQWLHSHVAVRLRRALRPLPKVVVTTIPFHVGIGPVSNRPRSGSEHRARPDRPSGPSGT